MRRDPQKTREYARRWYKANADKVCKKTRDYYKTKGKLADGLITREDADKMIEAQQGRCYLCGNVPSGKGKDGRLHIDHCHSRLLIRKALCGFCNTALGLAKHNPELLRKMADYLEQF